MNRAEARERLDALNNAIAHAVMLIKVERATLDQFFVEARNMESIGPILDPTLFNSSERRAAEALLRPIFAAARALIDIYDEQTKKATEALFKVDK